MKSLLVISIILIFLGKVTCAQFAEFASKYGTLSTIAGAGNKDDRGTSGWLETYEGKEATNAELSRPHFAMADSFGNIYIADKEGHGIRKVTPEGIINTVAGTGIAGDNGDGPATSHQLSSPNGIWVNADGTFFILDLGNSKIRKVDSNGKMLTIVDDPNGISLGRGLWVSKDEQLIYYVSGTSIKKWTPEEGIVIYASGFSSPGHILVDPSGKLNVTDRGANRVYRILSDGSRENIAGNGLTSGGGNGFLATETGLDGVRGIWFMEDKSYLLATHEGSQIWYVDTAGIINLFLDGWDGDEYHSGDGEHFQTPGLKISEPRGVSVDYEGNIIITENDLGFIRKIARSTTSSSEHPRLSDINVDVYPNPFYATTFFKYVLSVQSGVKLCIYNALGQEIETLVNQEQSAGEHSVSFNAGNLSSGVYFYTLKAGPDDLRGKILLLK